MSSTVTTDTRHLTASAVVLDPDRRLVLLVDHKAEGQRQFPGGHVDPDETPCEAAMREVLEETGVVAHPWQPDGLRVPGGVWHPSPLATVEFAAPAKPDKGEPAHHHVDELFIALADSEAEVTARPDEVDGAHWVPVDDLGAVRVDVPMMVRLAWKSVTGQRLVRG